MVQIVLCMKVANKMDDIVSAIVVSISSLFFAMYVGYGSLFCWSVYVENPFEAFHKFQENLEYPLSLIGRRFRRYATQIHESKPKFYLMGFITRIIPFSIAIVPSIGLIHRGEYLMARGSIIVGSFVTILGGFSTYILLRAWFFGKKMLT